VILVLHPASEGASGWSESELAGDRSAVPRRTALTSIRPPGVHGRIFDRAVIEAVSSGGVTWT